MNTKNIAEFMPLFVSAFEKVNRTLAKENEVEIFDSTGVLRGKIYMFQPDRIFHGGAIDWAWLGFDCGMECSERMEFMKSIPGVWLERREQYSFACGILSHQTKEV